MASSRGEDPRLNEVKAVLQRLQRISADPQTDALDDATPEQAPAPRRLGLAVGLGLAAAVLVAAGAYVLDDRNRLPGSAAGRVRQPPVVAATPAPEAKQPGVASRDASLPPVVVLPATTPRPVLEAAMGLLNTGRVQAARRQLLAIAAEEAADVAWALARSYDPKFLATIPAADAEPDVAAATRWYRAWHTAAVKQGLVTEGVSLERIIESMR